MAEKIMPEWIGTIVGRLASMFSLDLWRIEVCSLKSPNRPAGHGESDGLASFDPEYYAAEIFIDHTIEPDERGLELIAHEVLHLVFCDMRTAVADIVEFVPDEAHREALRAIYDRVEEQTITRLARGMARNFDMRAWIKPRCVAADILKYMPMGDDPPVVSVAGERD